MGSAHPRSRGENGFVSSAAAASVGSSPLTRGKRGGCSAPRADTWLIPAHAGKTPPGIDVERPCRAHPRSRGENVVGWWGGGCQVGSSPLTRGKLGDAGARTLLSGLIPAHAGKTLTNASQGTREPAHPRSRGENFSTPVMALASAGSSPLTRGKRGRARRGARPPRLIPAHAGKTSRVIWSVMSCPAHPRSRGEND